MAHLAQWPQSLSVSLVGLLEKLELLSVGLEGELLVGGEGHAC